MVKNNKGSLFFFGFLILFLLSFACLSLAYWHKKKLIETNKNYHMYLCVKKFDHQTKKLIKEVEHINIFLETGEITGYLSYIPGFTGVKVVTKILIKMAIYYQNMLLISHMQKFINQFRKKCPIPICSGILSSIPYEHFWVKFKRKNEGPTIKKQKSWKCIFKKDTNLIIGKYSFKEREIQSSYQAKELPF